MRHNSEFLFGIYWWIWKKQLLKKLLKWTKKKRKKSTWRYYFTTVYQKPWWYDLQFLRYWVWMTEIGNYELFFAIHCKRPPPKNQNFEKMRKLAGDIILYMCTKNHNHTRHRSWDMEWDRQNILLFWAIFCRFTSLLTPKIKIGKKIKTTTTGDIIFLHVCTINENHMMYNSWDIRCDEQNFLPFWAIFCPLTLLTIQHIKILKKWEKCLKISSFYT